ncbi:hypothetical protein LCO01nite_16330 [Lapidilactobacillus concavus]|nr:hypothetical protein LCO01nite_16330 [Lapidilactobacillus concavus]
MRMNKRIGIQVQNLDQIKKLIKLAITQANQLQETLNKIKDQVS